MHIFASTCSGLRIRWAVSYWPHVVAWTLKDFVSTSVRCCIADIAQGWVLEEDGFSFHHCLCTVLLWLSFQSVLHLWHACWTISVSLSRKFYTSSETSKALCSERNHMHSEVAKIDSERSFIYCKHWHSEVLESNMRSLRTHAGMHLNLWRGVIRGEEKKTCRAITTHKCILLNLCGARCSHTDLHDTCVRNLLWTRIHRTRTNFKSLGSVVLVREDEKIRMQVQEPVFLESNFWYAVPADKQFRSPCLLCIKLLSGVVNFVRPTLQFRSQ